MLLSFPCSDYFVQVLFVTYYRNLLSEMAENLVMVVKFTFQSVFGNSRRSPRHYSARGREESLELYSILWSDRPTSKQKVLSYGKSFCCSGSQTLFFGGREATTGNASAVRRLVRAIHLKSISSLLMLIQGKQLWYFTHFSIKQISPSHRFPDTNSVAYSTGDDNISYIRYISNR